MTIETFECPSCGAPAHYNTDSGESTITCQYCGNTIIVPENLRKKQEPVYQQMTVDISGYSTNYPTETVEGLRSRRRVIGCVVLFVVMITGITVLVPLLFTGIIALPFVALPFLDGDIIDEAAPAVITAVGQLPTSLPEVLPTPTPGFATEVNRFGGEGTGPGFFTDARAIAVDGEGRIYVGEYQDGRLQVFTPEGEFITVWNLGNETPLTGLAANRTGTVYAVYQSYIHPYDAATGTTSGPLPYSGDWGFRNVAVGADGGLVAAWYKNQDDLVWFDAQGNAIRTVTNAISGQTNRSELNTIVAVDGLGNVYALGTFNTAVFKFGPDGQYINRFGGDGDAPGQFHAPLSIAVDAQGRVYVGDIKGVQVFGSDGHYIDVIDVDGSPFGLTFTADNHLLVAARTQVIEYVINQ